MHISVFLGFSVAFQVSSQKCYAGSQAKLVCSGSLSPKKPAKYLAFVLQSDSIEMEKGFAQEVFGFWTKPQVMK
jgi:hypothetical protein